MTKINHTKILNSYEIHSVFGTISIQSQKLGGKLCSIIFIYWISHFDILVIAWENLFSQIIVEILLFLEVIEISEPITEIPSALVHFTSEEKFVALFLVCLQISQFEALVQKVILFRERDIIRARIYFNKRSRQLPVDS